MKNFDFIVTITAESEEMAMAILSERINFDEEYPELGDPEYQISATFDTLP